MVLLHSFDMNLVLSRCNNPKLCRHAEVSRQAFTNVLSCSWWEFKAQAGHSTRIISVHNVRYTPLSISWKGCWVKHHYQFQLFFSNIYYARSNVYDTIVHSLYDRNEFQIWQGEPHKMKLYLFFQSHKLVQTQFSSWISFGLYQFGRGSFYVVPRLRSLNFDTDMPKHQYYAWISRILPSATLTHYHLLLWMPDAWWTNVGRNLQRDASTESSIPVTQEQTRSRIPFGDGIRMSESAPVVTVIIHNTIWAINCRSWM